MDLISAKVMMMMMLRTYSTLLLGEKDSIIGTLTLVEVEVFSGVAPLAIIINASQIGDLKQMKLMMILVLILAHSLILPLKG